jgi:O-antigen/teichoic acid export membrane protein
MLRKLAGQTAIYGLSTIGVRLLNYLLTPYLTRRMTTGEYGVITDIYSLIPFLLVLLTMGLETGFFRFFSKGESGDDRRAVFRTTWGAVCCSAGAFLAIVLLLNRPIARLMEYADHPSYIGMMALIVALDVVTAVPFAKLRAENRAMHFVGIRLTTVLLNIALCVFCYSVLPHWEALSAWWNPTFGPGYYMVANVAVSFVALLLLFPAYRGASPKIEWGRLRPLLVYSLPLLIAAIPGVANEFIDRQFIKYMMPEEIAKSSLGIYGAVTKLAVLMTLFVQMYRYAAEPFFLANFKSDEFRRVNAETMKYYAAVSVLIFLGITLFSDLFAYFIGADFRVGMYILPVILLSNVLAGIVLNLSFWYKHSELTRFAVIITSTGFVVTVLLNLVLIPPLGYIGAAWARLGCEAVMVIVSYLLCQRYFPIPYNLKRIGLYFGVGALFYGLGMLAGETLPRAISAPIDLVLLAGFCTFVVRVEKIDLRALVRSLGRK